MAELVDAQVSEACCREAVEVRFFSSAPSNNLYPLIAPVFAVKIIYYLSFANIRIISGQSFCLPRDFCVKLPAVRNELIKAILDNQAAFGLDLASDAVEKLGDYSDLVREHNPLLHLVAPCSPEEFAIRHILESLTLLEFLPESARFADVGAGAGLPSIPCLLVRKDLQATLIESKEKKARFLEEAASQLGIETRARIINRQFEEVRDRDFTYVTCRALEKFSEKLPRLLKWTDNRTFLFFGGPSLREALEHGKAIFESKLMPRSEQRYVFVGR